MDGKTVMFGLGAVAALAGVAYVAYNKGYEDGMEPIPALTDSELAEIEAQDLAEMEPVTTSV